MKLYHYTLGLLLAAGFVPCAEAAPRTQTDAKNLARTFMASQQHCDVADIELSTATNSTLRKISARNGADTPEAPYYVFNNADGGYVIVSGSDLMRPVLGYSDHATISDTALPDNVASWFEFVADATAYVEQHPEAAITEAQSAALSTAPIEPLLGGIMWGQDAPYNGLCPSGYPTGCLATAMAQIMRYHRYPAQGVGSYSYSYGGVDHSVDFSAQTYNWDLMYEKYDAATATAAQDAEVAKLSYQVGVSLSMAYGAGGSGAITSQSERALRTYFAYNRYTSIQHRLYYTFDEWNAMMLNELVNQRPILFTGVSSSGGHAFVLDGYNADGFYHVNWGWDGLYNGYFDVCILNPEGTGTGATTSTNGFSTEQAILVNLSPIDGTGEYICSIHADALTSPTASANLGDQAKLTLSNSLNYSDIATAGTVGAAFTQNGVIVRTAPIRTVNYNRVTEATQYTTINNFYTVPTDLADGDYRLYAYFQPEGETPSLIHTKASAPSYVEVTVSDGKATFSKSSYKINATLSNWNVDSQTIYNGSATKITVDFTNNDTTQTVVGNFSLNCTPPEGFASVVTGDAPVTIAPGETKTLSFTKNFEVAGNWSVKLYFARQNIETTRTAVANGTKSFTVELDETANANFTLMATPFVASGTLVVDSIASFGLVLKNDGGAYSGSCRVQFFKSTSSQTPLLTLDNEVDVAGGVKDTVYVHGVLSGLTAGTTYYVRPYYLASGAYTSFTPNTGISSRLQVSVKAASDNTAIRDIASTPSGMVEIYNILGKRIATAPKQANPADYLLPAGIYIIDHKKVIIK